MLTTSIMRAAFLTDAAGNVIAWNDGCERLFGLTEEQILNQPMSMLLSGNAAQEVEEHWRKLPRQSAVILLDIHCADGRIFSATLSLAPQHRQDGAFPGWIAAFSTELENNAPEAIRVGRTPLSNISNMFAGTFYVINRDRRFVLWNLNLELVTGMTPQELADVNVLDMVDGSQRTKVEASIRQVFEDGSEFKIEVDYKSKSGREAPFLLGGTRIQCNGSTYLFGMGVDISERREQEKLLRLRERALHASRNGIAITRCEGIDNPVEYVNPAFERITGYTFEEVRGRDCRFMAAPGLDANERALVHKAVHEKRPVNVVFRNIRKEGDLFWNDLSITPVMDENGTVTHFIGVITDVTAAKRRADHLEHEVNHDALTGLANRNLMWDRLEHAILAAQRHKALVATMLIDLNNFKNINDTYGHEAGDVVLQAVAKRLMASVRQSDTVARLSGDEFVVVLDNQPSLRYTLRMVERLRQDFVIPIAFDNKEIPVGASIGVSVYPHDGRSALELVRAADVAMYNAKASGSSDAQFFSADIKATTEAKQRLETSMQEALERDELFLVYQPRVCVSNRKITGLEALLRWRHPEEGIKLPRSFLPEAEENGIIVQIGQRVLDRACAFIQELRQRGYTDIPVTVNVSQKEYRQQDFVSGIAARLARYDIPPGSLEIDLLEQNLIHHTDLGCEVANRLRDLGISLSVDEFGEGIFNLALLQTLSVRNVKIAKAAVHAISQGKRTGTMAESLVYIGRNFGLTVIGAAVETREQMDFLQSHGCDEIQGVIFSEPLIAEAVYQMLETSMEP